MRGNKMSLLKPPKLNKGDKIATISPCWGAAGEKNIVWKYRIGKLRLEEMGLKVVAAPNSMKGEEYLQSNPEARAEDILWAFENIDIKAIIANIGGNDSEKVLPYLNVDIIKNNPKIFIGYSDVMNLHLFCYKAGLSTFYGHNLLPILAETPNFHPYSKQWFERVLFNSSPIGQIKPAEIFSCDENNYTDKNYAKIHHNETGYLLIQGSGKVQGRLFGGHTGIKDFTELVVDDFTDKILFIEDISEFFTPKYLADFADWLGNIGALQKLKGLLIGKLCEYKPFDEHKSVLLEIVNDKYGLNNLPIVANMNFGHTSPICILPYGALAEIDCESKSFSIIESGVL
jgi:muramoyltetrapeptide carboxypeptidase LdcA involved in peptidoglycan recycling